MGDSEIKFYNKYSKLIKIFSMKVFYLGKLKMINKFDIFNYPLCEF